MAPPGSASLEKIIRNDAKLKKASYNRTIQTNSIERNRKSKHTAKTSDEVNLQNINEFFGRLDGYDGFFSTQQLEDLDFSKFENHVFFDSAVSKVHYAYEKIFNEFPYDKSEYEFFQYYKSLDGFTKYILDNKVPKSLNYLNFNGVNEVFVIDKTGNILDDFVGQKQQGLFNFNKRKFSFDFWLWVNTDTTQDATQIVFQKKSGNNGITIFLDNFNDTSNTCQLNILINHANEYQKCYATIPINEFIHANISVLSLKGKRHIRIYKNGLKVQTTSEGSISGNTKFEQDVLISSVNIGNGASHSYSPGGSLSVSKTSGLKGALDEFRFFTGSRTAEEIYEESQKEIHARGNLQVYYKFNEPNDNFTNNHIVLDSSGNRVHGLIRKNDGNLYDEGAISAFRTKFTHNNVEVKTPIIYEKEDYSPVIFLNYSNIKSQQNEILESAEEYDKENPNAFFKLFPKYIFVDGSDFDGLADIYASKESIQIEGNETELMGITKPNNSTIFNLLSIWSRFFDGLKCYVDHIVKILKIDYEDLNENKNHAGAILPYALKKIGVDFREIFPSPIIEKLDSKNLTYDKMFSPTSIRQIQNNLWKRFLINSQDFVRSKGTVKGLKSVFNSFGLEPDTFISFREFNSQNKLNMTEGFVRSVENVKFINFFESYISNLSTTFNNAGFPTNRILLNSNRIDFQPPLDENGNKPASDGHNFGEDFAVEAFLKFDKDDISSLPSEQSIFRLDAGDENANPGTIHPFINLVFKKDANNSNSSKGKLSLHVNETNNKNHIEVLELNDVDILTGKLVYICVNKKKKTDNHSVYDLVISGMDFGSKNCEIQKGSLVINIPNKANLLWSQLNVVKLKIGQQNIYPSSGNQHDKMSYVVENACHLAGIRVWDKYLTDQDIKIHKTDLFCYGLKNDDMSPSPYNSNKKLLFNVNLKERFNTSIITLPEIADNDRMQLVNDTSVDNKSNNEIYLHIPDSLQSISPINSFDYINLRQAKSIDFPENYSRVNINSFESENLKSEYNIHNSSPDFSTEARFVDHEDIRFTIDFSISNFINNEMSKMIQVNDFFTKTLSNRSSLYEDRYQSLEELKVVFFEKLKSEINIRQLYQIYKYFDNILEGILDDAIPSKVHYHGFNFVFESHISERPKYVYKNGDSRFAAVDLNLDYSRYDTRYLRESYWDNSDIREDIFTGSANVFDRDTAVKVFSRNRWGFKLKVINIKGFESHLFKEGSGYIVNYSNIERHFDKSKSRYVEDTNKRIKIGFNAREENKRIQKNILDQRYQEITREDQSYKIKPFKEEKEGQVQLKPFQEFYRKSYGDASKNELFLELDSIAYQDRPKLKMVDFVSLDVSDIQRFVYPIQFNKTSIHKRGNNIDHFNILSNIKFTSIGVDKLRGIRGFATKNGTNSLEENVEVKDYFTKEENQSFPFEDNLLPGILYSRSERVVLESINYDYNPITKVTSNVVTKFKNTTKISNEPRFVKFEAQKIKPYNDIDNEKNNPKVKNDSQIFYDKLTDSSMNDILMQNKKYYNVVEEERIYASRGRSIDYSLNNGHDSLFYYESIDWYAKDKKQA